MATAATCNLELGFTGLCMFVSSGGAWWVLLPDAPKCEMPVQHIPRLVFAGGSFDLKPKSPELDLTSLAPAGTNKLPRDIINPGNLAGAKVKGTCTHKRRPGYLATRVRLPGSLDVMACNVAELVYSGVKRRTAALAIVVIPNVPLDATNSYEILPGVHLKPQDGVMAALVANLPEAEYAQNPVGPRMTHFRAYLKLLSPKVSLSDPDEWNGTPDPACTGRSFRTANRHGLGMDPYTCMISGGCPTGVDNC